jgi:hypothetical protein
MLANRKRPVADARVVRAEGLRGKSALGLSTGATMTPTIPPWFLTDPEDERDGVVLPLQEYEELLGDLEDLASLLEPAGTANPGPEHSE